MGKKNGSGGETRPEPKTSSSEGTENRKYITKTGRVKIGKNL
jgi:hypothetical protein